MASYPPPPGGPQGPYGGNNPLGDRRFDQRYMKAEARLRKAAARSQRAAERMQRVAYSAQGKIARAQAASASRALRRSSILGPVLLLGAGVLFLMIQWGTISMASFSLLYSHWWPLLLVGAGVILLLEWVFDQQTAANGAVYTRRGVGGGVVLLIIMVAASGAMMQAASHRGFTGPNGIHEFAITPENVGGLFGDKQESESDLDLDFPAKTHLSIENPHGDVTVVGHSEDGKLHVTIHKSLYVWSLGENQPKADKLTPNVVQSNGSLLIQMPSMEGATADLTVTVPETGATTVTANHGAVNVSGMKAPVEVTSLHGTVDLNEIIGTVTARTSSNGSSFTAHAITGDVSLKGHADDLNLSAISGQVALEGEFYGDTHMDHLGGPVSFDTSRTHFKTAKVGGEVDISSGESMTADHLIGPTMLKTKSRNVNFTDLAGDVNIVNSNGSIELGSAVPLGNVTVENRSGSVTLNIPSQAGFVLQAETKDGHVENNFGLSSTKDDSTTRLSGKHGDGKAQLDLRTTHADIEIHAGPEGSTSDEH